MSGVVIWLFLGGGLVALAAWRWLATKLRIALPFVAGAAILLAVALSYVAKVAAIVFSVDGLLWSFGLGGPTAYPVAVRVGTWVLVVGGLALVEWISRRIFAASAFVAAGAVLLALASLVVHRVQDSRAGGVALDDTEDGEPITRENAA